MNGSPAARQDCPAPDNLLRPADLIAAWQQRADYLHQFGDPNSGRIWRTAAVELERTMVESPGLVGSEIFELPTGWPAHSEESA